MANSSFKRSGAKFKAQPTVLILCEDEKSGKKYIEDAATEFRARARVMVIHPKNQTPDGLFNNALKEYKNYDKIYCVFDRDKHTDFDKAVSRIKGGENGVTKHGGKKIVGVVSYPCFEYWLVLHFTDKRRVYSGIEGGKSICKRHEDWLKSQDVMKDYDKGDDKNLFRFLGGRDGDNFLAAMENSERILAQALGCPSLKTKEEQLKTLENKGVLESSLDMDAMNPSTQIHLLMDILEKLSKPELVQPK